MKKIVLPKITALAFGILVLVFAIGFYILAWQEPTQAPPGGNVPTPLNISATPQTKEGDLTINGVLKTLKDLIVNAVTIKGDGSVSPNLNADKLDSYNAADFLARGIKGMAIKVGAKEAPTLEEVCYSDFSCTESLPDNRFSYEALFNENNQALVDINYVCLYRYQWIFPPGWICRYDGSQYTVKQCAASLNTAKTKTGEDSSDSYELIICF